MPRHDPSVRMLHMRDFAEKALAMCAGRTRSDMDADEMFSLAVTRLIELVGEAASHVPREVQQSYPQIPWPKVVGIRNRLIHGYDYVDYDIVWNVVHNDLPQLLETLNAILPPDR